MFESEYYQKPRLADSRFPDPKYPELKFLEPRPPEPKPGALFEGVALTVAAIAFGCVTFADFLSHAVQPGNAPFALALHGDSKSARPVTSVAATATKPANAPGIDYSATGSINSVQKASPVNPCEMKR